MEQEKKKLHIPSLIRGLMCIAIAVLYVMLNDFNARWFFAVCCVGMGVYWILLAFRGGPEQPVPDPRPLKERLRQELQDYAETQLRSIVDDKLRGGENNSPPQRKGRVTV